MAHSYLVAVVALLVALSVVVSAVAAVPSERAGASDDASVAAALTDGGRIATIDPSLREASGTTQIVLRLAEPAIPPGHSREEVLSLLKTHAERSQRPAVEFVARTDGVEVLNQFWVTNAVLLEVDTDKLRIRRLAALPGVEYIHPNRMHVLHLPQATPVSVPADGLSASGAQVDQQTNVTYGLDQIQSSDVWDEFETTGEGVRIAVLDTGLEPEHPDLTLFSLDPTDPTYPGGWAEFGLLGTRVVDSRPHDADEQLGHGTHVSGTVAGGAATGTHIGVAPGVTLLHGQVLNQALPDGQIGGTDVQIYAGMQWGLENDADVLSMSLGGIGYWPDDIAHVRNAEAAGAVVVASIGNSGSGTSGSPGNVYEALSVGASDQNRQIVGFSSGEVIDTSLSWGAAAPDDWPDTYVVPRVSAPGVDVVSAAPGGAYQRLDGTSMAAPHVTGTVALLLSATDRELSPAEVKSALAATAFKPPAVPAEPDPRYGAGIVDALEATRYVTDEEPVDVFEPNDGFDQASPIVIGRQVSSELTAADVDVFRFDGADNDTVTVTYDRASDAGVTAIALYGPDRDLVTMEFVGTGAEVTMTATPAERGPHYVQVVDVEAGAGEYELVVTTDTGPGPVEDPNEPNDDLTAATPLGLGGRLNGVLDPPSDLDWFTWDTAGGEVSFVFERPAEGNGTLELTFYDVTGQQISNPFPTATDESLTVTGTLPPDTYYVQIASGSDAGSGPYTLRYAAADSAGETDRSEELNPGAEPSETATPADSSETATPTASNETATPADSSETATPADSSETATPTDSNETATPTDSNETATPGQREESTPGGATPEERPADQESADNQSTDRSADEATETATPTGAA